MAHTSFRLSYFTRFGPTAWQAADDRLHDDGWWTGDYHLELAKRLDATNAFDFLFFDDTCAVSRLSDDKMDSDLRYALYSPRHDALPLLPVLARETKALNFVTTAKTTYYPPFILSRLLATLDHLTRGRVGWNIVTSLMKEEANNHNLDDLPPHAERYEMADEFLQVADGLWNAYDDDALAKDMESYTYIDPSKVRELNHKGKYFKVRGPMNMLPSPQRRPVLVQAGSSQVGRDLAAKWVDCLFAPPMASVDDMREFRAEMRQRAANNGRNPDDLKIVWAATAILTEPGAAAPEFTRSQMEYGLATLSADFGYDLRTLDWDKPLPEHVGADRNASTHIQIQRKMAKQGIPIGKAAAAMWFGADPFKLLGSPKEIADRLMDAADAIGGDAFMMSGHHFANRAWVEGIIEVSRILQDRGVVRKTATPGLTFRQRLREPITQN